MKALDQSLFQELEEGSLVIMYVLPFFPSSYTFFLQFLTWIFPDQVLQQDPSSG